MKAFVTIKLAAGLLLAAAAAVAGAQRADVGQRNAQRAIDTAARVQDRAARAQDRSSAAQDRAARASESASRAADAASRASGVSPLARARNFAVPHLQRFRQLVRANPQALELVDRVAAVRSQVVSIDPSPPVLEAARNRGYRIVADETIEGLDTRYVTLALPPGTSVTRALAELRRIAPGTEFAANHLHLQSGSSSESTAATATVAPSAAIAGRAIGIIDGGVADSEILPKLTQRGFAAGAPAPSAHGTAVASLAAGTRRVKSGSPGTPLLIADVYGRDPKGGNSLALARALGWLSKQKVPVVVLGLVGPSNPIVARAIKAVQARGIFVVAPVGNAGAAAPPMFPAAYPGVIGVTGVDSKNRALIEAGRGAHVDYAAPGADIFAAGTRGQVVKVRGTSYAAPLVAGRLWLASRAADPVAVLNRNAVDLGRRGPDRVFGRGLVCGKCR